MILRRSKLIWSSTVFDLTTARRVAALFALLTLVIGCGRSEPESADVVEPPLPATVEPSADAKRIDPPGGIELPPGEIPPPSNLDAEPDAEKGIQLPSGSGSDDDTTRNDRPAGEAVPQIQYASWQQIEQTAKSTGKVTVVDLWALSCEPCLKEFPGLVKLHHQLGRSISCIAVNLDYVGRKKHPPTSFADKVESFLAGVGAGGFATFISETPSDDIYAALDISTLPAVIVYRADGTVARLFDDAGDTVGFTYDKHIAPLVTELVQK